MSTAPPARGSSEQVVWWTVLGASVAIGLVWAFATPLFTGPDEVSQARRAAAVARGELTGRQDRPGPPLLLTVRVPPLYGTPAEEAWLCHLGPLVEGTPQQPMPLPSPPCPDLRAAEGSADLVEAETVQYRGQPFFYAVVGTPTLVSQGVAGARLVRVAGVLLTAPLVASAAATVVASHRRALAGLGLLACLTPGLWYLSGSTNPSAVEVAAALSAWAAAAALAASPSVGGAHGGRLVRRLGVALVVLTLCRGLGPGFAAAVVAAGALAAGRVRSRELLGRRDLRAWAAAVAAATAVSLAWLVHISASFPLPERAGTGAADTFALLPWYLRQVVGVFGTNDSAVAPAAAWSWCAVAAATVIAGVVAAGRSGRRQPRRQAAVGVAVLAAGLALNVTAEGLSLPPIGFFWQGRYALPLLVGGILLATTTRSSADHHQVAGRPPHGTAATTIAASAAGAVVLLAVHVHGLWVVTAHHGTPGGALRVGVAAVYVGALAVVAVALLRPPPLDRR